MARGHAPMSPRRPVSQPTTSPPRSSPIPTTSPWWLSGQLNLISQAHPGFAAAYSGPNSLSAGSEIATSFVATIYSGYQLTATTEVIFDVESAGGRGLSDALGIAGFTNLDVVRNPTLGSAPYIARLEIHQVIPLSDDTIDVDRGWQGLIQASSPRAGSRSAPASSAPPTSSMPTRSAPTAICSS